ncbi:hypothetical protein EV426DRAFT_620017 [Tirmania nivea]|nr:hypothetical protein EV426DRAFT_620017 [Tirmania nivea]
MLSLQGSGTALGGRCHKRRGRKGKNRATSNQAAASTSASASTPAAVAGPSTSTAAPASNQIPTGPRYPNVVHTYASRGWQAPASRTPITSGVAGPSRSTSTPASYVVPNFGSMPSHSSRDAHLESTLKAQVCCFLSSLFRDSPHGYSHRVTSLQPYLEAHLRNHFTTIQSDQQWEQILGWRPLHTAESAREIGLQVNPFQLPPASRFGQSASLGGRTGLKTSTWAAIGAPVSSGSNDFSDWSVEYAPAMSIPPSPPQDTWATWLEPNPTPSPPVSRSSTPPIPQPRSASVSSPPGPQALAEEASVLLEVFCQSFNEDAASADHTQNRDLIKGALDNVNKVWDTLWGGETKGTGDENCVQSQWADDDPSLMVYSGCVICYSAVAETVLLPCNHLVLCVECCDGMGIKDKALAFSNWANTEEDRVKCPLCRVAVSYRIKIFRG